MLRYFYQDIIHLCVINSKQDNLTMIQIAADLAKLYTSFMEQKGVETDQHRYYIKWLCYYLDFCPKYKFKPQNKEGLSAFLEKLKKKQAESLRKQAHHAVSLFYEMGRAIFPAERPGMVHPMARAPHMDALSRIFLFLVLKKKWCLIKQFSLVVK